MPDRKHQGPIEIPLVGDLTENAADLCDKLLSVEPGGSASCISIRSAAAPIAPSP